MYLDQISGVLLCISRILFNLIHVNADISGCKLNSYSCTWFLLIRLTIKLRYIIIQCKFCHFHQIFCRNLFNSIQDGGGRGGATSPRPTSFSSVTSANVGVNPQNFLTFCFNLFVTLLWNFKFVPSASPKLFNLNHDYPSKKVVFLVKTL